MEMEIGGKVARRLRGRWCGGQAEDVPWLKLVHTEVVQFPIRK